MSSKSGDVTILPVSQELILAVSMIRWAKASEKRNRHIDEVLGLLNQRYVCETLVSAEDTMARAKTLQAF
jgi:hypothetical protein